MKRKFSRRVLRRLKHLALLMLLAVAGFLSAGRLLLPMLPTQTDAIEARLSRLLNADVSIGEMRGDWFRFGPILALNDLQVRTPAENQVHVVGRAIVALDMLESLLQRRLVVDSLSIADMSLGLQQQPDGRWTLAGIAGSGGDNRDLVMDFLLKTDSLNVNEAAISLQPVAGQAVALSSIYLNIQNRGDRHEAQLQLRVNGQLSPAQATLQLEGDPRAEYSAVAWVDSDRIDWLPLARTVLPEQWRWQRLEGRARLWATLDSRGLQRLSGQLEDLQADARHEDGMHLLSLQSGMLAFQAQPIVGDETEAPGWSLQIPALHFDWDNRPWEVGALTLATRPGNVQLQLQAAAIDMEMLSQVLTDAVPMPNAARSALQTLQTRGTLRNLQLQTALDGSHPQGFLLRGNLEDTSVAAWQQAPAGSGIDAYVEASAEGGFVEVDSRDFRIHLPRLFSSEWQYDRVNGRVSWRANPDEVHVQSTAIEVANADLAGRVRFDLHNLRDDSGAWLNELQLLVGMQRMRVPQGKAYLPMLPRLQQTMSWLEQALQGGELGQSGFVLRSLTGRNAPRDATHSASWYRVRDGRLRFLPDWPALEDIEAGVVVRDEEVDVVARRGTLAGISIDGGRAELRRSADDRLLSVAVHADTETASGLEFLKTTPVHERLGSFLDAWQATGNLDVDVGVGVNFADAARQPLIDVTVVTADSMLDMTDYALQLDAINGSVHFSTGSGLEARNVSARLFDEAVRTDITTTAAGTPQETITIHGEGGASVSALQAWSGQPEFVRQLFGYMQGEVDYRTTLLVEPEPGAAQRRTKLTIESNLAGLSSSLPAPLTKATAERRPFTLALGFASSGRTLDIQYQDWLTAALILDDEGIERGQISLGDRNRNFNVRQSDRNAEGVLVTGTLPNFDVSAWEGIARELNRPGGDGRAVSDYLRLVDVNIGELMLPGRSLDNVNVVVEHPDDAWKIRARNDFLAGEFLMPDDAAQPWDVTFEYLRFPPRPAIPPGAAASEIEDPDPLENVDPTALPPFNFSSREISVGDQTLGEFSFRFRPHSLGATISDFRMQSPDSRISDVSGETGADLEWTFRDGIHTTSFTGVFAAGDLSRVLPAWGQPTHVASESARFENVLEWPGSPLHFSLKRLSGTVNLDIDDGRFVEISSGSTRLLGALNFEALARRLQLDFSDIFGTGFSFDSIDGLLTFTQGVVDTTTPLRIDGPSSDIAINGKIDLEQETIAADMQVQIPLGQNVSMVAGLLGAWPIAVSTYIASKILQNSVEDFATVVYRLEGPWVDPRAGFETPASEQNTTDQEG